MSELVPNALTNQDGGDGNFNIVVNPMKNNLNADGFRIYNVPSPTSDFDAVNKKYTDNLVDGFLTNPLPDTLNCNSFHLRNVADPVNSMDGCNKKYVDSLLTKSKLYGTQYAITQILPVGSYELTTTAKQLEYTESQIQELNMAEVQQDDGKWVEQMIHGSCVVNTNNIDGGINIHYRINLAVVNTTTNEIEYNFANTQYSGITNSIGGFMPLQYQIFFNPVLNRNSTGMKIIPIIFLSSDEDTTLEIESDNEYRNHSAYSVAF